MPSGWAYKWEKRLREELAKYEEEIVEQSVQVAKQQDTCKTLTCENDWLNKKVDKVSKQDLKGNGE